MKSVLSIAAVSLLISSAAFAQTATPSHPLNAASSPTMGNSTTSTTTTTTAAVGGSPTVSQSDQLSSEIVGLSVYNPSNQSLGTIKDIAYSGSGLKAYIIGVGGVMGVGDHYVAVNPSDVSVSYDSNAKKWRAQMNATADQLKAAPQFNYPTKS